MQILQRLVAQATLDLLVLLVLQHEGNLVELLLRQFRLIDENGRAWVGKWLLRANGFDWRKEMKGQGQS